MKHIFLIKGRPDEKNRFAKFIRFGLNLYTRHRNPYDSLERAARLLGCTANKKERKYYDELIALNTFATEQWDFKTNFAIHEIEDFLKHDRAEVLVLHGYDQENVISSMICEKYGAKTIELLHETPLLSTNKFDYVLCVNDPDFEDQVKKMLGLNLPEMEAKLKSENQN